MLLLITHLFKLLSRRTKIRLYKNVFIPILQYGCWPLVSTKAEEKRQQYLREYVFGHKRNTDNNKYEQKTNTELK